MNSGRRSEFEVAVRGQKCRSDLPATAMTLADPRPFGLSLSKPGRVRVKALRQAQGERVG